MLQIKFTNKMKRDAKLMRKRGKDMNKLTQTLSLLASQEPMPERYLDHQLTGSLKDFRECHIEPDWLLIYQVFEDSLIISASGTGTHSDLFSK
jgi:mRNA interferase YafQ